ncbi:F-box domain containing protein [Panicum miliaceum]|uniref:F-box domain containing protein n=1 Tax=Panicum miliaceum TaxID=4540 RepID=A0A3L6STS3_PANMI|nr:F-box domain containing protein [Panicum miliaceum]
MAPSSKKARAAAAPCHQNLPDELLEEILARMPAKSVLRCRCLSRSWAAALSSDAFVDKHLDLANRRYREALPPAGLRRRVHGVRLVAGAREEAGRLHAAHARPAQHAQRHPRRRHPPVPRALAPATRRRQAIAALPDGRMAGDRRPGRDYASFGLGYDARARAHKVVRLLYHDFRPAGCDIYDVGAGSAGHWRPAASGAVPPERARMNQMGVFAHGHVHWVTMTYSRDGEGIVSFSMAREEFGHVTPPPPVRVGEGIRLTELAGCLCLLSAPHSPKSPQKYISIWLLAPAGSWEQHCHIDLTMLPPPPPEVGDDFMFNGVTPLALVNGGRRILFVSEEYQVAAYCLATGSLEELIVRGIRGRGHLGGAHNHQLVPYEESLMPAGRPFEDILFSPPPARALSVASRRLPARALGCLKLVCRSWRAMSESDRFVASQNARARETAAASSPVPVVFVAPFEFFELASSLASCSGGGGDSGADGAGQIPPLSRSRVVCRKACHGLLLLSHQHSNAVSLRNPVTRSVGTFVFSGEGHGCAGLGYDPSREEHVLVRLSYASDATAECQVWPLRDLRPRTLASPPPIPAAVNVPPVHVGGKMYLPGEPRIGATAILAFDIPTETFEVVPAPPVLLDADGGDTMVLTELDGKLCAAHTSASTETVTVWSKNDAEAGWTMTQHAMQLQRWPEFSPRSAELAVPVAVDPRDGRVLVDIVSMYTNETKQPKFVNGYVHTSV